MIEIAEAIKIVIRETSALTSESVHIDGAVGRILAENIVADADLPPFDRSQMDGFAVIAVDTRNTPATLKIVGESAAGRGWHDKIKSGQAVRIMTGAPVPAGADAVQKIELTRSPGVAAGGTHETVDILESVKKGSSIVRCGAEIKKGSTVFLKGEIVTPNMIAAIASFGYAKTKVGRQPRVGILSTGSEIVDVAAKPGRDQIRNSNSSMLRVLAEKCGAVAESFPIASDDLSNLKVQIISASKNKDILIITGGVSVGKYDLTKLALTELGAEIFFEKVRLKPGKPTVFARLNKTLVFGLPGNPVSAAVTFYLFVRSAIVRMQGATATELRSGFAIVGSDVKAARDRDSYLPSTLATDRRGYLIAVPLKWQGSSDFIGFARAEALIVVASGKLIIKGEPAKILFL